MEAVDSSQVKLQRRYQPPAATARQLDTAARKAGRSSSSSSSVLQQQAAQPPHLQQLSHDAVGLREVTLQQQHAAAGAALQVQMEESTGRRVRTRETTCASVDATAAQAHYRHMLPAPSAATQQ